MKDDQWLRAMGVALRDDVVRARKEGVCRLCGGPPTAPLLLDFGREFAHTACLSHARAPRYVWVQRRDKLGSKMHLWNMRAHVLWRDDVITTQLNARIRRARRIANVLSHRLRMLAEALEDIAGDGGD